MFLFASTSYPVRRLPLLSLRCFFFFSCTKRQFIQSNYRLFIDPFRHTSFDHAKKRRKIKKKSILYILKCLFENIPSRKKDPFFIIIKYLTVKTNSSLNFVGYLRLLQMKQEHPKSCTESLFVFY